MTSYLFLFIDPFFPLFINILPHPMIAIHAGLFFCERYLFSFECFYSEYKKLFCFLLLGGTYEGVNHTDFLSFRLPPPTPIE